MENRFLDYESFKTTNEDLINHLVNNHSLIIDRFKYVLMVVDYLFDKAVNSKIELDNSESEIFEVGYSYIYDRFMTINLLKENVFNNNLFEMEQFARTINLLLYVNDFIDEVDSKDIEYKKEHKLLADFEEEITKLIENKKQADEKMFIRLDDLSSMIFSSIGEDYYGVPEIFYDIACEYDLVSEDDEYIDIDDILNGNVN